MACEGLALHEKPKVVIIYEHTVLTKWGFDKFTFLQDGPYFSGKVFASQERVSCFPEKGLTSGEVRETSGEVRETSGEVWETSGEPLDCCKVPQFHSERTSGEVAEKLPGKFGELPGKSGDFRGRSGEPDTLPFDSPNLSRENAP